jgi:hypothetical protein
MRDMKLTPEKLTAFCAALAETCNVGKACTAVGISRMTAYTWRSDMPDFADAWERAMKAGLLALEDEAHRRAFEGLDEPVFYKGDECGTVRKYSDTLAIFLLKAHDPEKYRENSKVELSGSLALNTMSDEEIRAELAVLTAGGALHSSDDVSDLI